MSDKQNHQILLFILVDFDEQCESKIKQCTIWQRNVLILLLLSIKSKITVTYIIILPSLCGILFVSITQMALMHKNL